MAKLSIENLDVKEKRVLMRVDFNVPMDSQGHITDDSRIKASLKSIQYILDQGGSVILMSHLGRPKIPTAELSLAPIAKYLSTLLKKPVIMAPDCVGAKTEQLARDLKPGQILLLENLRFHNGEEHPNQDPQLVEHLAKLGDVYVNDAFGAAHRKHASTAGITRFFPNTAAMGFLMQAEVQALENLIIHPKRPFYALIGGAKVSSKIGALKALLHKADALFIGGGMAFTFLHAQGIDIGNSLFEPDCLKEVQSIIKETKLLKKPIFLPCDVVIAKKADDTSSAKTIDISKGIPEGYSGVDIGPKTIEEYVSKLKNASTIFWNGPVGIYEIAQFAKGTRAIAQALADMDAIKIIGGGESVAAVEAAGVAHKMTHISTGGGASLEFIEFGTLPGIEALTEVRENYSTQRRNIPTPKG